MLDVGDGNNDESGDDDDDDGDGDDYDGGFKLRVVLQTMTS